MFLGCEFHLRTCKVGYAIDRYFVEGRILQQGRCFGWNLPATVQLYHLWSSYVWSHAIQTVCSWHGWCRVISFAKTPAWYWAVWFQFFVPLGRGSCVFYWWAEFNCNFLMYSSQGSKFIDVLCLFEIRFGFTVDRIGCCKSWMKLSSVSLLPHPHIQSSLLAFFRD